MREVLKEPYHAMLLSKRGFVTSAIDDKHCVPGDLVKVVMEDFSHHGAEIGFILEGEFNTWRPGRHTWYGEKEDFERIQLFVDD